MANIENHFNSAKAHLETANLKVSTEDSVAALVSLAKAHENTRELMSDVYELKHLKACAARPAQEDTG